MAFVLNPDTLPASDNTGPDSGLTCTGSNTNPLKLKVDNRILVNENGRIAYQVKNAKRERGWRKIVRNFTPS